MSVLAILNEFGAHEAIECAPKIEGVLMALLPLDQGACITVGFDHLC